MKSPIEFYNRYHEKFRNTHLAEHLTTILYKVHNQKGETVISFGRVLNLREPDDKLNYYIQFNSARYYYKRLFSTIRDVRLLRDVVKQYKKANEFSIPSLFKYLSFSFLRKQVS